MPAYEQTKEKAVLKLHGSNRGTFLTQQTTGYDFFNRSFYELPIDDNGQILIRFITSSAALSGFKKYGVLIHINNTKS